MSATEYRPIEGITPRVQEVGRIRMGEKDERGLPRSIQTFRLTSYDTTVLAAAAARYGGVVKDWKDAPDPGTYELVTDARALEIYLPRSLRSVSQWWELWKGGVCERRCDGRNEEISAGACICGPARGTADDVCDVVTRVSVILRGIPGLGLWRLDTGGYNAATSLPSTIDFLMSLADPRVPLVPAVLRAVPRSSKVRDPRTGKVQTHRFVVPVLDAPDINFDAFAVPTGGLDELPESIERPRPPTAEERAAAAAEIVRGAKARLEAERTLDTPDTGPASGGAGAATAAPLPEIRPEAQGPADGEGASTNGGAPSPGDPDVRPCGRLDPVGEERCTLPMGHPDKHHGAKGTWR